MTGQSQANPVTRRVVFHGRVQGVGFRYTTTRVAQRYPVKGYVRNLSDGTVELVVQASADVACAFQAAVEESFRRNITGVDVEDLADAEAYSGFHVR